MNVQKQPPEMFYEKTGYLCFSTPGLGPGPDPQHQFVFYGPDLKFVFHGPGPQFVLTGPGPQFVFACSSFYLYKHNVYLFVRTC